ncbi:S-adenosylmethionine-dependent methyltransferase domain-containing protein [Limanda limanda]|uniref:S-adenosylmethionine-dependent methyltransferase domain-containing protein n=1 Tax=Limanda limanda TaxID=27771 RepID=UPI0029C6A2DA|nr:S-adenosylmethionine-dependent methyltransferase domain-containing protein [Limanda limanda]
MELYLLYLLLMEKLSKVSKPVRQKTPGNQTEENDEIQDVKLQTKQEMPDEELTDKKVMAGEALNRRNIWEPSVYYALGKESFHFAGHDISIRESIDTYGALIWPGAVALCQFLENNRSQVNLMDKAVLEIGAGTGLLSILASLLGAWVTATDLPDILPNLTFNLLRNTRGRSRYTPQVAALTWGQHLEQDFPHLSYHYDYVLAADVVYHHASLEELLQTMQYFCQPGSGTTLLWANKIRFQSDLRFSERFESSFNTTLLPELPQQEVRIYQATAKE